MKLDLLDPAGTVVRFPTERRRRPDIFLSMELSAVDEYYNGVLDEAEDTDRPDWEAEGAEELAALVAQLTAAGAGAVLAAARAHVDALVKAAVADGWSYRDAHTAAADARAALKAAQATPEGDWLGRYAAELQRSRDALHPAALASARSHLLAMGADDALTNLAAGRGARQSTKAEMEAGLVDTPKMLALLADRATG